MKLLPAFQTVLRQRKGRLLLVVATAVFSFVVVRSCQRSTPTPSVQHEITGDQVGIVKKEFRDFETSQPTPKVPTKPPSEKAPVPPISLFFASTPPHLPDLGFLPSGTLIPSRLLITVDSSSLDTPVVGIVTEDTGFNDRTIIPKRTRLHSQAQPSRLRDRIACPGPWTFVFETGEEVTIQAIALDRQDQSSDSTDGSAGLRGTIHKADHYDDLKLLTASFLEGMTDLFQQRRTTPFGFQVLPNAKNAALGGAGEVLQTYAERLVQTIETESMFVRVPAGKSFYVYLREPLERNRARAPVQSPFALNPPNSSIHEEH